MKIGEISMNLIDESIIDELSKWATENEDKNVFPQISCKESSYYVDRESEETYMMEYSINTLQDLKTNLKHYSDLSDETEILKLITVGVCKECIKNDEIIKNTELLDDEKQSDLPEFIYVF
jgi:hypothetical protein